MELSSSSSMQKQRKQIVKVRIIDCVEVIKLCFGLLFISLIHPFPFLLPQ